MVLLRAAWEGGDCCQGLEARGPRTKLERKARASAHRARVGAAAGRRLGGRELQDRRLAVALFREVRRAARLKGDGAEGLVQVARLRRCRRRRRGLGRAARAAGPPARARSATERSGRDDDI